MTDSSASWRRGRQVGVSGGSCELAVALSPYFGPAERAGNEAATAEYARLGRLLGNLLPADLSASYPPATSDPPG